jgi:peptidoglycan/xylan/chitin deacetylase (PgdA/CDA1 family)
MKKFLLLCLSVPLTSLIVGAACPDGKTYPVTLTFDDGPHPAITPKILDVLKEEKVKATFFVLGEKFEGGKDNAKNAKNYALLDREKREGHYIGSHTYHHLQHNKLSPEQMRENITKPNQWLEGYLAPILRLPYGSGFFRSSNPETQEANDTVMRTVRQAGFEHVAWDIDSNDWDATKRTQILPTVLKEICEFKGGIILFHDIHRNTADHLKEWIRAIRAEGHTIVGMEEFVPAATETYHSSECNSHEVAPIARSLTRDVKRVLERVPENRVLSREPRRVLRRDQ